MRDEDERQVSFGWSGVRPLQRAPRSDAAPARLKAPPQAPGSPAQLEGPRGRNARAATSPGSDAYLLTIAEVAEQFLRTTPKAVRRLIERRCIPGVVRVGRRVLFRRDRLGWQVKGSPRPRQKKAP